MTYEQKNEILKLIEVEKERLGSYSAVAKKCGVSDATISYIRKGTYTAQGDDAMIAIGAALGWSQATASWNVVETQDMRRIWTVLNDSKEQSLFIAISEHAGGGKSTSTKAFAREFSSKAVFRLECREWGRKQFIDALCKCLGLPTQNHYDTALESVTDYLKAHQKRKPLIIIDEADKLKPAALRTLIPLYNECEGVVGVTICGTENLEKEIKAGVRFNRKGFDEIDSRFGRKYVKLEGANESDVTKICNANGITDAATCKKIFEESDPLSILGKTKKVVKDLRRVHRLIKRELLAS